MGFLKRLYRFGRYNRFKKMTIKAWIYSAYYRYQMLHFDTAALNKKWGIEGKESPKKASIDEYRTAMRVSYVVNTVCNKTKWESKCLVRALTAQKLLEEKGILSTMYLGVGYDENKKKLAHSWLRCGEMFVTGGDGKNLGLATVAYFCTKLKSRKV